MIPGDDSRTPEGVEHHRPHPRHQGIVMPVSKKPSILGVLCGNGLAVLRLSTRLRNDLSWARRVCSVAVHPVAARRDRALSPGGRRRLDHGDASRQESGRRRPGGYVRGPCGPVGGQRLVDHAPLRVPSCAHHRHDHHCHEPCPDVQRILCLRRAGRASALRPPQRRRQCGGRGDRRGHPRGGLGSHDDFAFTHLEAPTTMRDGPRCGTVPSSW